MRLSDAFLSLVLLAQFAVAERLPLRSYTPVDGLPGISVHRIVRDSKGFLWFCTNEGLSRFDGYGFKNFGRAEGLPDPNVNDFLETKAGDYWAGTPDGLYRLTREAGPGATESRSRFVRFQPPVTEGAKWVHTQAEDSSSAIWVGTRAGLFRLLPSQLVKSSRPLTKWQLSSIHLSTSNHSADGYESWITVILCERHTNIWIGSSNGLYLQGLGRSERFSTADGLPSNHILSLAEDREGKLWVGTADGLCRLKYDIALNRITVERSYSVSDGLPSGVIKALLQTSDGSLWIGTSRGLAQIVNREGGIQSYSRVHGLGNVNINALAQDRNGNLWIGTDNAGAIKFEANGFISYGGEDGLGSPDVVALLEDQEGTLCVVTRAPGQLFVNRLVRERFHPTRVPVPARFYDPRWLGWYQVLVQSRSREWWIASMLGLFHFPAVNVAALPGVAPVGLFNRRNGLGGDHVHQVFEDSLGRLWISIRDAEGNSIVIRDPGSGSFYRFSEIDGLPSLAQMHANGFFEDRAGQIWIGLHRAGVLRFSGRKFQAFYESDGLPKGGIRRFHQDGKGRLWLGSGHGGLGRIDDPQAARPKFVIYDVAQGLSGSEIQAITEDQWGRIYAATGHGVDRLDPSTGRIHWYTTADGLAPGEIQTALRDRQGALWFGTVQGVSSFKPVQDQPPSPPPIRIMGVRISGIPFALDDHGETEMTLPDLPVNRNHIQVDFVGFSFTPGDVLRYQSRLEQGETEWSRPGTERSVIFANLAPGSYRFLVRALSSEGYPSASPASIRFRTLPPLWARGWFLALLTTVVAAALFAFHRYRMKQLLKVQRLRTNLSSDLHDEIGSGLALIGVLSGLAQERLPHAQAEVGVSLKRVAEISRELLESMSDIVWTLDGDRDRIGDLTSRMRRFANEIFSGAVITLDFRVSGLVEEMKIDPEKRRHIYLIFRESVRNILRHSRCTKAAVYLSCTDGELIMIISDDGVGFDPAVHSAGHGLTSMRARARSLGGRIEWTSGKGTVVTLRVPPT